MEEVKRKGNPNFGRRPEVKTETIMAEAKPTSKINTSKPVKEFRYQLIQTHENLKPREWDVQKRESSASIANPYPPVKYIPNDGVAYDPQKQEMRQWRYIFGMPSIWLDEQKNVSKAQLDNEKNTIMFDRGFLRISATDKAKKMAVEIQDIFEGNESPLNQVPKQYRLIDEGKQVREMRSLADMAYEAETYARNSTIEELLPVAMVYGIDINESEEQEERIRTQLIIHAKGDAKNFLVHYTNPLNKVKYVMVMGLQKDIINASRMEGKLIYSSSNKVLFDINPQGDVADQVARMVIGQHEDAMKVFEHVKSVLEN